MQQGTWPGHQGPWTPSREVSPGARQVGRKESAVNTRCQLSSDFLHVEQIIELSWDLCSVQGGVADFEMGAEIDPGGHEALILFLL